MVSKLDILKICKKCGEKCCKLGGPVISKEEKNKILKAGFDNFFIKSEGYYIIKRKKDGNCIYLKDHKCLIHKVRPIECETWPVSAAYKWGKVRYYLGTCPLTPKLNKKEIETAKKKLSKLSISHLKRNLENAKKEFDKEFDYEEM